MGPACLPDVILNGLAILAGTELTTKSQLFEPARKLLLGWGVRATIFPDVRFGWLARFLADAWTCPFCSSFWHGAWSTIMVGSWDHLGFWGGIVIYLPSIGMAKILHDTLTTHDRRVTPEGPSAP